jgi:biotin carboxyl carrier protein
MNKYQYKVQGVDYEVEIEEVEGNIAKVNVNGIPFEVEMQQPINAAKHPTIVKPKVATPAQPAAQPQPTASNSSAAGKPATPAKGLVMQAPLPGTITNVLVKVGESVFAGQVVVILEAMKMQNNIEAEESGVITAINVNPGDTVMEGAALLTIDKSQK